MDRRNPTAQTPLFLAVAFVHSALLIGLVTWLLASPHWGDVTLGALDLFLVLAAFLTGVAGMGVAFHATRMRGWMMQGGRISGDGARGASGVDTGATYLARAIPRFIAGSAMVESCAVLGLVMALVLKQPEAGLVLCGLGVIGTIKLMFPALLIMRRASALKALEAAALAGAARA